MLFLIILISFIASFISVPAVIAGAGKIGAVAIPGKRHIHKVPTPKMGGISIALGVYFALLVLLPLNRLLIAYMVSSVLMLLLGVVDDLKESSWKTKLTISLLAISIFVFGGGIWIKDLGNLFGDGDIHLGLWGIPFTYFAIFGIINAINLIDGLNGLACGVSVISFIFFAVFAYLDNNNTALYISLANMAGALGLIRYNYPKAKLFIGDSGSLFIGFSLAALAILLTQGKGTVNPMSPVMVLLLPIFDTLRVMGLRIRNKRHPFRADKTHLHHLMTRSGMHQKNVVKAIWLISTTFSVIAFLLRDLEGWMMLLFSFGIVIVMIFFIESLHIIRVKRTRESKIQVVILERVKSFVHKTFSFLKEKTTY